MLRACVVALALIVGSLNSLTVQAQTPELTIAARSPQQLSVVIASFGDRGEMFGLTGPAAFLSSYGRFIQDDQPLSAALTFTTKVPMFAAEFTVKEPTEFFAALAQGGIEYDSKTGALSKTGSSLRFFARQTGKQIRIADNAEFLKNVRWPAAEQFGSDVAVLARIDWRNLQPEIRGSVAQQAMSNFLPQTNPMTSFSLDTLPELISTSTASRIAGLFVKSETITLQFSIAEQNRVTVTADVVNRAIAGRASLPSPFASMTSENKIASCEWNTPIDAELRSTVQTWAGQLVGMSKQMFAGDEIGDDSGLKVLHEAAAVLAKHCTETIALQNLQGSLCTLSDGTHPIVVGGLRVANPARLDRELQKLIKLAVDTGAPIQFTANVSGDSELNMHRIEMPIAAELANARELFGESLTIHLATSSHALLVGVGKGSEKFLAELVSPANGSSNRWIDASVSPPERRAARQTGTQALSTASHARCSRLSGNSHARAAQRPNATDHDSPGGINLSAIHFSFCPLIFCRII